MSLIIIMSIILYVSIFLVLHSYLFYPLSLALYSRLKKLKPFANHAVHYPELSILIAAHNEASVLEAKLESILNVDYPREKLSIYIGSDNSIDATNDILKLYSGKYSFIKPFFFSSRTGKPGIINFLADSALRESKDPQNLVFIITDADILHEVSSFKALTSHFVNSQVDLVDTNLVNVSTEKYDKAAKESNYLKMEVYLKNLESIIWKRMMGPFGGCFAIRAQAFEKIPDNFLVDDFYLAMRILEKGNYVVTDISALAFEDTQSELRVEYRRKRRISAGNFQNLSRFKHLLISSYSGLAYAFFSHKVLRWFTPFFLLTSTIVFIILCILGIPFYIFVAKLITIGLILLFIIELLNIKILKTFNILSNLVYFILMNIALFHGFIDYIKGIRTNVWQPTERSRN